MSKIGIITYHSAYNFGSVLQAYATLYSVKELNPDTEIINYRMEEQKKIYSLYRTKYGIKTIIKDLLQLPVHSQRKQRTKKFESFINNQLCLSKELSTPKEVSEFWSKYDIIISGSDQIWSKHSLELEHNSWKFMNPYLLNGYKGKKISYASSVGTMTDDDIKKIIPALRGFSSIAMREKSSAERISQLSGLKIESVLDPTFLLDKAQWEKELSLKKTHNDNYILFYSLGRINTIKEMRNALNGIVKKYNIKIKVVTPFLCVPFSDKRIEIHPEYGPVEFLNELYNAKAVITNSYHGTILSVNLGKDVYSWCKEGGAHYRKTDILERLGLSERIIYDLNELLQNEYKPIDYTDVYRRLDELREQSIDYLQNALMN